MTKFLSCAILYTQGARGTGSLITFPGQFRLIPLGKTFQTFSSKPLDKHRILCYNQSVNKREGLLFRTEFLRVVSFPIWHLVYIPPFERRLVVLPVGFHIGLLSMRRGKTCDDVERIHTHCKKRKRLLAVEKTLAARN